MTHISLILIRALTYCSWTHRCSHCSYSSHYSVDTNFCIHPTHSGTGTIYMLHKYIHTYVYAFMYS